MILLIKILLSTLLGSLLGSITGLTPGLHINLIASLIIVTSSYLLDLFSPLLLSIIIISMSITHIFLNFIPSTYLGAPDSDSFLITLPAHKLLLQGQAYHAIILSIFSCLSSLILIVSLSHPAYLFIKTVYPLIKSKIPYILIAITLILILREKNSKFWSLITTLLSGSLGLAVLNFPNLKEPLLPLLSGLFGTSILLHSFLQNLSIPSQESSFPKISFKKSISTIFLSTITGSIFSFLPAIGPSQAAVLATSITKINTKKRFLILSSSISIVSTIISFITLFTIEKSRNGSVVAISKLLYQITPLHLLIFFSVSLISSFFATFLTLKIAKIFSKIITKINYKKISLFIIAFISILVFFISGVYGLLVLFTSTFLGLIPTLKRISKNHLMSSLIIPVILYML